MDAFESLVATVLRHQGYWVWPSFRVALTKENKRTIGRPSSPDWEIDIVAYKGATNRLFVVECKSYIDSSGVLERAFSQDEADRKHTARYKLFNDENLRNIVLSRLEEQLVAIGACQDNPLVTLCLAAGNVKSEKDRVSLHTRFTQNMWLLWDENWLKEQLCDIAARGYQNDIAAITAKLLLRGVDNSR